MYNIDGFISIVNYNDAFTQVFTYFCKQHSAAKIGITVDLDKYSISILEQLGFTCIGMHIQKYVYDTKAKQLITTKVADSCVEIYNSRVATYVWKRKDLVYK